MSDFLCRAFTIDSTRTLDNVQLGEVGRQMKCGVKYGAVNPFEAYTKKRYIAMELRVFSKEISA